MPTQEATETNLQTETNKKVVERWFEEVWNQGKESTIDELYSPGAKSYGFPNPDSVISGPEPFKTIHRQFRGAFPDTKITFEDIVAEGDLVAVRWRAALTHLGDHLGIHPSHRKVSMAGSSFVRIRDGQIVEGWNHMDMTNLLNQLR